MRVPANKNLSAYTGNLPFHSLYTAGLAGQAFLQALKDNGDVTGTRCGKCDLVYVPNALFCERCFDELTEQVTVGPEGEVVTFTVGHIDLDGNHLDEPYVVAAVRLDGATSVLVHHGLGDPAAWAIGARAKVVVAGERTGSINDIKGFELT